MPALENPSPAASTPGSGEAMSAYEQSRAERIRENLAKMQKLGIFDLSLNLKLSSTKNLHRSRAAKNQSQRSEPTRRSSRLKNGTPVSHSEVELGKKNKVALRDDDLLGEVGSLPEIYTEKHEKLLGSTEKSWTLFMNGCGSDERRKYNQNTCHQCRQKTLGYRTRCNECYKVRQFCGDCLYMRYGEHVLEALENPEWICPVCRGICNCNLCREEKGWAPTGAIYDKVTELGYKSVAHYLILTRRLEANPVSNQDAASEVSGKRSLAFSDVEAVSNESVKVTDDQTGSSKEFEDKLNDQFKNNNDAQDSSKLSLLFHDVTPASESITSQIEDAKNESTEAEEKALDRKQIVREISSEKEMDQENTTPKLKQISSTIVTVNSDSIAGKLKQRHGKSNECNEEAMKGVLPENEVEKQNEALPSDFKYGNTPMENTPKHNQKRALAVAPSEDNIAGRSRQRRKMGDSQQ